VEQPQGGLSVDNTNQGLDEPTQDMAPEANDKPFNDEPFNAGVESDEADEPKKFIQQLSGKLGQSLRKYTDESGQPDFDLEKFAINSVISATHTSEMDEEDKKDIISKINNSGKDDTSEPQDNGDGMDNSNLGPDNSPNPEESNPDDENNKKNFGESLNIRENKCNFVVKNKTMIKTTLKETFDCGCNIEEVIEEIMAEPAVKPQVKPDVIPDVKPSRRSSPYKVPVILPEHSPKPKANLVVEGQITIPPIERWYDSNPNELLKIVYWNKGQVPPADGEKRKEAFIKIVNQLDSKYPSEANKKAEMINKIS
jgi:hypothetical protein